MKLRALTLHRPWPWLICQDRVPMVDEREPPAPKRIENRTWPPPVEQRGKVIAIHAGRVVDPWGMRVLPQMGIVVPDDGGPRGVVALARVTGLTLDEPPPESDPQRVWWWGPYAWLLSDVKPVPPIPCRGKQGLWPLPSDVEEQLSGELA